MGRPYNREVYSEIDRTKEKYNVFNVRMSENLKVFRFMILNCYTFH